MNASLIIDDVKEKLRRRFGAARQQGRGQVFTFGEVVTCSINYSKLLNGHKYFYAVPTQMADSACSFPEVALGEFVVLICGSADKVLVLPRSLVTSMLSGVPTRRVDVFVDDDALILQTTKHPKLDVTQYLNAYPAAERAVSDDGAAPPPADRLHVRIQWELAQLGIAEGCSVWVPTADRNLSFQGQALSSVTMQRLPHLGIDPNSRRIVENIDVLWLSRNAILKAFEIESTTSIYSGLLRLSDLVVSQPNSHIDLFVAAEASKRPRVAEQLFRPTLQNLLNRCRYLSFDEIHQGYETLTSTQSRNSRARLTGLIEGEAFTLPSHYVYPTDL